MTKTEDFGIPGEMSVDVSLDQLEKTYGLMSEYGVKSQEVTAILRDFEAV